MTQAGAGDDRRSRSKRAPLPHICVAKLDASDLSSVKGQLAKNRPVIFAMTVGLSFFNFRGNGIFDTLEYGPETTGHSMVLVGFDDDRSAFRLMNSFGRDWGEDGYAWISYELRRKQVHVGFVIAP